MKVGYHDNKFPSGLTPFILEARQIGLELKRIYTPSQIEKNIEVLIINPLSGVEKRDYWQGIREMVKKTGERTRVILITPFDYQKEFVEQQIGTPENLEYLTYQRTYKLKDLLPNN